MTYTFTNEYKADMHNHITKLFSDAKTLNTDREARLAASDELVEAYFAHCGKVPDSAPLERLATLILRDELTDSTPWKTRNTEYPIESPRQEKDYYSGLSTRDVTETFGTDGTDYRIPTRRQRTPSENAHMDREYGKGKSAHVKMSQTK